ncbi:MAG: hypothetical protein M0Q13_09795 [Methanothrix sp.]|jgi:hypothetical protein|nr:hypothetical protein [Methanothrix sp.]
MADYSNIVKNINDIPNFISNEELRNIINIGIHDAIRHSNKIGMNSSVIFNITVYKKNGLNRTIKCETFFKSSDNISCPLIRRTTVEPNKQNDIVSLDLIIEV